MSTAFNDFLKKAQGALTSLRGGNNFFLGKNGEIIYSKNNVCIHESSASGSPTASDDNVLHMPGYLTIYCLNDEQFGITLVLQWLPNATLEKNPASIRCISPRSQSNSSSFDSPADKSSTDEADRMMTTLNINAKSETNHSASNLGIPSINVIPNTPIESSNFGDDVNQKWPASDSNAPHSKSSDSSDTTSGADEISDRDEEENNMQSSSCDDSEGEEAHEAAIFNVGKSQNERDKMIMSIPEQFAKEHNLMLDSSMQDVDETNILALITNEKVLFQQKSATGPPLPNASLFSVNLGKMRSMRIFYSNAEHTSGQLVIASRDSQYKILHFHHGGLDKLAQLLEHWNAVKAKSVHDGSPTALPDRHLLICQPEVSRVELDPEDGLYNRVNWEFWKSYKNSDGSIDDGFTIRKEIWPFLLRIYPWNSTFEQREAIRNELFLSYQNIKRIRIKRMSSAGGTSRNVLIAVESTITKDVIRTDRRNPFYAGDDNGNLETMISILLNYAASFPDIGYIQGMSDLLAPLLSTLRDEVIAYWCFVNLMQQTLFCSAPLDQDRNQMEINLEYLRELLKLKVPDFFAYLERLGGDAIQLMFVHRWILLFFKREFPEADALHIWEACWARYRTSYFHLFVCAAIVSIYGPDIIAQSLPHDEILLYFSSLSMHMDANVVLKKARGLLYNFYRLPKIPCTLAGLCERDDATNEQWSSHTPQHVFECTLRHGDNECCPFAYGGDAPN